MLGFKFEQNRVARLSETWWKFCSIPNFGFENSTTRIGVEPATSRPDEGPN